MEIRVIASGSSGNATFISDGVTELLLDAGISIRDLQEGTGFGLSSVAGCFVTHEHGDHSKAVRDLCKRGIDVYASAGTLGKLNVTGHRTHALLPLEAVTVGSWEVLPFDVTHDAEEPLGFLVESKATGERLVYFSDTAYVKYTFGRLNYIIAECNHGEDELRQSVKNGTIDVDLAKRITENHMSLERLLELLKANDLSKVKAVYLIHLSDNNSDAERFKTEVQRVTGTEVYVC